MGAKPEGCMLHKTPQGLLVCGEHNTQDAAR
jgi:hypothetical protein